ncbi:hypothetical protein [Glycomyces sp. NPDC047010]|uniref:hypothetical protein n=1 Tax=Glycomyces sp. NPDC047010 TaxID=3155023 RepID=UPI0033DE2B5F
MAKKIDTPKLWELWRDPEGVAFDPTQTGMFATDRFALWDLSRLPLADAKLVPDLRGFYSVGKSRVALHTGRRFNAVRSGHMADKFAMWSAEKPGRVWEPLTHTVWRHREHRVCLSASGPVLVTDAFVTLAERFGPLWLSVCHTGKEFPKVKVTWLTEISEARSVETVVGFIEPGKVPDSDEVRAVLGSIGEGVKL